MEVEYMMLRSARAMLRSPNLRPARKGGILLLGVACLAITACAPDDIPAEVAGFVTPLDA